MNKRTVRIATADGLFISISGPDAIAVFQAGLVVLERLPQDMPGVGTMNVNVDGRPIEMGVHV